MNNNWKFEFTVSNLTEEQCDNLLQWIRWWVESSGGKFDGGGFALEENIDEKPKIANFVIYWKEGFTEIVKGSTITEALTNAGYDANTIFSQIDHHETYPVQVSSREESHGKENT